jgi:four helix bundle protein
MSSTNNNQQNPLVSKSFNFALQIVRICQQLQSGNNFVFANQLLKSGTSIGANIREAQSCESRADFIHKLKIAAKEAQETEYWLLLLKESDTLIPEGVAFQNLHEIQKILTKSIITAKSKV